MRTIDNFDIGELSFCVEATIFPASVDLLVSSEVDEIQEASDIDNNLARGGKPWQNSILERSRAHPAGRSKTLRLTQQMQDGSVGITQAYSTPGKAASEAVAQDNMASNVAPSQFAACDRPNESAKFCITVDRHHIQLKIAVGGEDDRFKISGMTLIGSRILPGTETQIMFFNTGNP
ncbi:hypothetical protein B0H19DRAFT_1080838 [Mycena capillaripes]|nr:hypothetical protein B0H19DRAFT_1080838 [Mycena capillaripes]